MYLYSGNRYTGLTVLQGFMQAYFMVMLAHGALAWF